MSPSVTSSKSLYMPLFVLKLFVDFYPAIENGAVEILADNLIANKSLAVIALCIKFALFLLQTVQLLFLP